MLAPCKLTIGELIKVAVPLCITDISYCLCAQMENSYLPYSSGLQPSSTALSASFAHSHNGDVNGVKFISLASPLNNDQRILSTASGLGRQDGPKNMGR